MLLLTRKHSYEAGLVKKAHRFVAEFSQLISTIQRTSNVLATVEQPSDPELLPLPWPDALKHTGQIIAALSRLTVELDRVDIHAPTSQLVKASHDFRESVYGLAYQIQNSGWDIQTLADVALGLPELLPVFDKHPGGLGYPLIRHLFDLCDMGHEEEVDELVNAFLAEEKLSVIRSNAMAKEFFKSKGLRSWK